MNENRPCLESQKVNSWEAGRVGSGQVRYESDSIDVEVDVESRSGRVESGSSRMEWH